MSDEALKPCALCGAALHLAATEGEAEWGVECCGCDGILIFRPTREEAVTAANARADESRIRADAMADRTREIEKAFRHHGRLWDEASRRLAGTGSGGFTQVHAEAKARHYHDAADYVMNRHPEAFPQPEAAK